MSGLKLKNLPFFNNLSIFKRNFVAKIKLKLKKNPCERFVQELFTKDGYEALYKGWPDFLFYKEETNEAIFVEVKKQQCYTKKMGLSRHQKRMHEIFKKLGFNVRVVYT